MRRVGRRRSDATDTTGEATLTGISSTVLPLASLSLEGDEVPRATREGPGPAGGGVLGTGGLRTCWAVEMRRRIEGDVITSRGRAMATGEGDLVATNGAGAAAAKAAQSSWTSNFTDGGLRSIVAACELKDELAIVCTSGQPVSPQVGVSTNPDAAARYGKSPSVRWGEYASIVPGEQVSNRWGR